MIFYNSSIEGKKDFFDRIPVFQGMQFKRYHFGLFKVWKAYQLYYLPPKKIKYFTCPEAYEKHLEYTEIKWSWK